MRESTIQAAIRKAIALDGRAIVTRNNVGVLRDERGVPVRFGLGVGSADLVGGIKATVLPPFGRLLAFEVKRPGQKSTPYQLAWARAMRLHFNAFVAEVHSVPEAMAALERACRGERQ